MVSPEAYFIYSRRQRSIQIPAYRSDNGCGSCSLFLLWSRSYRPRKRTSITIAWTRSKEHRVALVTLDRCNNLERCGGRTRRRKRNAASGPVTSVKWKSFVVSSDDGGRPGVVAVHGIDLSDGCLDIDGAAGRVWNGGC